MSTPTVTINPNLNGQFAIISTSLKVKPIYELCAKMPGYYGLNPTLIILTAINSLSISNPAVLELNLHSMITDIQAVAAGNLTKLDPFHEQDIATAVIQLWQELTNQFTMLQLWSSDGRAFWKFYCFIGYDIVLRYTGGREDELRAIPNSGSPIINGVH